MGPAQDHAATEAVSRCVCLQGTQLELGLHMPRLSTATQACRKLANAVRSLRSLSFHLQGNMVIGALATGGSWEKVHLERHDSGVTIRSRCQVMSSDVKCGLQALSVIDSMKRCQTIPDVVSSSSLGGFGSMVPQTFEHELS